MPYITCEDGETYSRYDNSPYVKKCIADQEAAHQKWRQEKKAWCAANPVECEEERFEQNLPMFITLGVLLALVVLIILKLPSAEDDIP